jgi:hypothetical protein
MKTLKSVTFAALALSIGTTCSGDQLPEEKLELPGTQWKLSALVNLQAHTSVELEPKACDKCYTIEFVSDTKAIGKSVMNELIFAVTPSKITPPGMTKIWDGEGNDAHLFYEAIQTIGAYTYDRNELKIYYDTYNYLSYKRLSR